MSALFLITVHRVLQDVYKRQALLSEPENIAAARQLAALGVESLNNTDEDAQTESITVTFKPVSYTHLG